MERDYQIDVAIKFILTVHFDNTTVLSKCTEIKFYYLWSVYDLGGTFNAIANTPTENLKYYVSEIS